MSWFLYKLKVRVRDWAIKNAGGVNAKRWLALFSFTEASFFPIPPDIFLIAILTSKQTRRWAYYSFLTSLWSVIGGAFGYIIGFLLFDTIGGLIITTYNLEQYIEVVRDMFAQNAFWAIFIAGFTPIPYKIFTISAGFFEINFFIFIIASIISRSLRFFALGYIMKVFGENFGKFIFKYFNIITLIFAIAIIIGAVLIRVF